MKTRRILAVLLTLTVAVAVASVVSYAMWARLPEPQSASGRELLRWLVERDLSTEPERVQRALVDRLAVEVRALSQWSGREVDLGDARSRRLQQNVAVLKRVWFSSRVDELFRRAPAERDAFLDEQIVTIASWSDIDAMVESHTGTQPPQAGSDPGIGFIREIDTWLAQASGEQHKRMVRAVSLGVTRWLMTCDLADESLDLRSELAERIARELDQDLDPVSVLDGRLPEERARLRANSQLLMEAWYHRCAQQYAKLSDDSRKATYVGRQIDRIEQWGVFGFFAGDESGPSDGGASLAQLVRIVETWIGRAPADKQPALKEFYLAVQQHYLFRLMKSG